MSFLLERCLYTKSCFSSDINNQHKLTKRIKIYTLFDYGSYCIDTFIEIGNFKQKKSVLKFHFATVLTSKCLASFRISRRYIIIFYPRQNL